MSQTYLRFFHPFELKQDEGKKNHGRTIYFRCLDCDGPALFDIEKRSSYCYQCNKIHKLHTKYKGWSAKEIVKEMNLISSYTYKRNIKVKPESQQLLNPYPLSQRALEYIHSRGISDQTLFHFPILQEIRVKGKKWLCWKNIEDCFELREIFGTGKEVPAGSRKNYSLINLKSSSKNYIIFEGLFDAMSYAQIHNYPEASYVILNSTGNINKFISNASNLDISEMKLALDCDRPGMEGIKKLYRFFSPRMKVIVDHPPKVNTDWNAYLMEQLIAKNS